MKRVRTVFMASVAAALLGACTWVKVSPQGELVRVASAAEVVGCVRKGKVAVSLKDRVAGIERKAEKVRVELETLARNEGALLGGDTVVAESPRADGRQTFGVFRCVP